MGGAGAVADGRAGGAAAAGGDCRDRVAGVHQEEAQVKGRGWEEVQQRRVGLRGVRGENKWEITCLEMSLQ